LTTPEKGQIPRHYQSHGGDSVRSAAAATARHFKLEKTHGSAYVKIYDRQIREGMASRANRPASGCPKQFNAEVEEEIIAAWDEDDTRTFREVAKDLMIPLSSLHRYTTEDMDFRMLGTKRAMGDMEPSASTRMHHSLRAAACAARN